jgi:integrase
MARDTRQTRPRGIPYIDTDDVGVWYVHWSDQRRSKRKSLGTRSAHEAQARFADWLKLDLRNKADEGGARVDFTVAELWTVYDTKHVQTNVMPAGRATIGYAWKNLQLHFGPLQVAAVPDAIDGYVAKRKAAGAAPATIRREVATLLAGLRFCSTKGAGRLIAKEVVAELDDVALPPDSEPRDRWLKMDEVQRLLDAAAAGRRGDRLSRVERFLWLALFTAARKEALLELTWDRVDFETNTIHLNVPGRRLTKKRRADVTIASQLRPVLERAHKERTGALVLDHAADDMWASIQYVAIRAGFSDQKVGRGESPKATGISPHVLRHTAATHMARRGVPLWTIAQILGNSVVMVEKVYAKWQPSDAAGTVDHISGGVLEPAE